MSYGDFNPYDSGEAELGSARGEERSSAPKWMGVLNIVFAALLMFCCISTALPMLQVFGQTGEFQEQFEAQRQEQIEQLEAEEEAAEDPAEKAELRQMREQLKKTELPDLSELAVVKDRRVFTFFATDVATSVLLNLLMLVAGIGLINYREWARQLALWVAGFKIARLAVVCVIMATFLAPLVAADFTDFYEKMLEMDPQAAPPQQIPRQQLEDAYRNGMAVWAGILFVLGVAYPVITLIVLNQSPARAACRPNASEGF